MNGSLGVKKYMSDDKAVSLDKVKIKREGEKVVFECPLGAKDKDTGKTPCDLIADLLESSKTVVTRNVADELVEKLEKLDKLKKASEKK